MNLSHVKAMMLITQLQQQVWTCPTKTDLSDVLIDIFSDTSNAGCLDLSGYVEVSSGNWDASLPDLVGMPVDISSDTDPW